MLSPSTSIRRAITAVAATAVLTLGALPAVLYAQTSQRIESVIMPGEVVRGHAKYESNCEKCHVRFDRPAQRGLCLDCHKEVANDVRAHAGYHGRLKASECRTCHTEHKGREARIVTLDEKNFDHAQTDFSLAGGHRGRECASCHRARVKHREAPSDCAACHRKDDKHKETLGVECQKCHDENSWKKSRFDHAKSNFPLSLRHSQIKCVECHADLEHYASTSKECLACHRKDDAHKGSFGARCEKCHDEGRWKVPTFRHDRDTKFTLKERHRTVKCVACHREPVYQVKAPTECLACHRKDDVHRAALGEKCENCHSEKGWKEPPRFDHDRDSKFPLLDRHRDVKCRSCHQDQRFQDKTASTCFACHAKVDREKGHRGRYGDKCQDCHTAKGWKNVTFVHDRDTRYFLLGRHARVQCDSCHKRTLFQDKADRLCVSCHERDDKHRGQVGRDCARCHNERGWPEAPFDHNRSAFPLVGLHMDVLCKKCHLTPAFKDAKPDCVSCHLKDDTHRDRLGSNCGQCHSAHSWKKWDFDHNRRTKFSLADKHARVKCITCHAKPVRELPSLSSTCYSCHREADDVHLGTYGQRCDECHLSDNWRHVIKRHADGSYESIPLPAARSGQNSAGQRR
jgi:hypothetical protein